MVRYCILCCVCLLVFSNVGSAVQQADPGDAPPLVISAVVLPDGLHTHPQHILRELTFSVGDTLLPRELEKAMEQSRINLVNTALFINHRISVTGAPDEEGRVVVYIDLRERWYFWPEPILENAERNFNIWMEERNLSKLSWGMNLMTENVLGGRERLTMLFRLGYDEKYEVTWTQPSVRRSEVVGFGFGAGFVGNHEVATGITKNRRDFVRADRYLFTRTYGFARILVRPSIHQFHTLTLEMAHYHIDDTLFTINPNFFHTAKRSHRVAHITWLVKFDHRNHRAYPLKGSYADLSIRYAAIPLDGANHAPFTETAVNLRIYRPVATRLYHAAGFAGKVVSARELPFYYQRGLGYRRNFVRGYEYYVMHGQAYALLRQNLKYALLPEKAYRINFMPHEKFRDATVALYVNLFTDAGYVYSKNEDDDALVNRWMGSVGVGFDLVTYYDKVMRIETTMNDQGKAGVFVHFIAPI